MLTQMQLRNLWLAVGWLGVGLTIYLSLTPSPPTLDVEQGDKFQHLFGYALLMVWFAQLALEPRRRWVTAGLLVALGVGLECAQGFTTWRTFSVFDMVANTLGVGVGWLLAPPRLPSLLGFSAIALQRLGIVQS
jgi:VanZ family protein